MKKTTWIIIIVIVATIGVLIFYFTNNSSNNGGVITNILKSLFPYGVSDYTTTSTTPTTTGTGIATIPTSSENAPATYDPLIQLSQRSVVGMTVVTPTYFLPPAPVSTSTKKTVTPTSTSTITATYQSTIFQKTKLPVVRFAERGTGYIYDVDARAANETKQTGTTIVRVDEVYFADNGNSVIFRYLKNDNSTIETFLGKIIPPTDSTSGQFATVKGDFLPENISDLVTSPDGKKFAYILPTPSGVAGVSISSDGSVKNQLFSSSFDEWLLDWKQGGLVATTKAASTIPGYSYLIQTTGVFQKIIGGIDGMTTNLSPDGKTILYNTADANLVNLFVRHNNGDSTKLNIATLPEKCVWSNDSVILYCAVPTYLPNGVTYPDDWYQGTAHFTDQIWKVNTGLGTVTLVSDLENKPIDAVNLKFDQNENYLFFINNNDGTPWSLDLKKVVSGQTVPTVPSSFPTVGGTTNQ